MLHWLLFKITFTVLYAQFCMSQKRICYLVVALYVANGFHDLLLLVFDFFWVEHILHVPPQEVLNSNAPLIFNGLLVKRFDVQIFSHLQKPVCTKFVYIEL